MCETNLDDRGRTATAHGAALCPTAARRTPVAVRHIVAMLTALTLTGTSPYAMAIEEPTYTVVRTFDDVEIRDYAAYVVAEVDVTGTADEAGSKAFPILAGYIFGKNKGERRMSMTAPVTQTEAPIRLSMTAPVTQVAVDGGYVVQFVLPRDVTLATAPEPLDPGIRLREEPAHRVAAIRYSGLWSAANYAEHLARLKDVLAAASLASSGAPVFARYDAPFKPWFLRRNEIWMPLARS